MAPQCASVWVLLLLLVFLLLLVDTQAAPAPQRLISVDPTTFRLVDDLGRTRIFHGVNVVYKLPPYHPPQLQDFDPVLSLCEADGDLMRQWGFNFVRLYTSWEGLEPGTRGTYNEAYLDTLQQVVEMLNARGIYVLLDAHQDILSRQFCGEGVPAFAAQVSPTTKPFPNPLGYTIRTDNSTGLPLLEDCLKHPFWEYYFTHASNEAFQNLYDNKDGIADSFAAFWGKVASHFKDNNGVIGYELLNEPWPGDTYKDPFLLIEQGRADRLNLIPLYTKAAQAIYQQDDKHIVFWESALTDVFPLGFEEPPGGSQYRNRSVLSYHLYCYDFDAHGDPRNMLDCDLEINGFLAARLAEFRRLRIGGFLTEFGDVRNDSTNGMDMLQMVVQEADSFLQSWSYWQYKSYNDFTTQDRPNTMEGLWNAEDGSLQENKLRVLSRTYAQAIAGEPFSMSFNRDNGAFYLVYTIRPDSSHSTTEIYLNEDLFYPKGFKVVVTPPILTWSQPEKNYIYMVATNPSQDSGKEVRITVFPVFDDESTVSSDTPSTRTPNDVV